MKYKEIIFLQGEEATEVLEILEEEGENAAFQHLLQWKLWRITNNRRKLSFWKYRQIIL